MYLPVPVDLIQYLFVDENTRCLLLLNFQLFPTYLFLQRGHNQGRRLGKWYRKHLKWKMFKSHKLTLHSTLHIMSLYCTCDIWEKTWKVKCLNLTHWHYWEVTELAKLHGPILQSLLLMCILHLKERGGPCHSSRPRGCIPPGWLQYPH